MATNTVTFPVEHTAPVSTISPRSSVDNRQCLSRHATALEICDLVYSAAIPSWDAIERFYEPNATYENPLVTATSRSVISDIHAAAAKLAQIDVPRPFAILSTLLGLKQESIKPWFSLLRVWSETGDVCESESFDGHRKVIVEHTLHILLLPGIHSNTHQSSITPSQTITFSERTLSLPSVASFAQQVGHPTTLGLDLSLPSPFHLRLPIISQLSFNDAGKITYHRDFWDVKDVLGLIPGMTIAQWISGRVLAQGIRGLTWMSGSLLGSSQESKAPQIRRRSKYPHDEEIGLSSAAAFARTIKEGSIRAG